MTHGFESNNSLRVTGQFVSKKDREVYEPVRQLSGSTVVAGSPNAVVGSNKRQGKACVFGH